MTPVEAQTAKDIIAVQILNERARQDEVWGEQNHPDGTGRPDSPWAMLSAAARSVCQHKAARGDVTWLDIAREEVFEAFAEADPDRLRTELIQAAAVFAAWAEAIDRRRQRVAWDAVAVRAPSPDDSLWEAVSDGR